MAPLLAQYNLVVKELYCEFYKVFFNWGCDDKFEYISSKTLLHLNESIDLLKAIIYMRDIVIDIDSWL